MRQCVILVGGLGTRLGPLTQATPKPLLPVGGRPFLDHQLEELARHGFTSVVLLAGHLGGQVVERYAGTRRIAGRDVSVSVIVEAEPAGTGGALTYLRGVADEMFLLANGDSWFDIDLRAFAAEPFPDITLLRMALRQVPATGRYGSVRLDGTRVADFLPSGAGGPGHINAGVYLVHRAVLDWVKAVPCSLEGDVFRALAAAGRIEGVPRSGFFLDIGVPEDYAAAQDLILRHRRRPAVFFDRDGTLNVDHGYTHRVEDLCWLPGARAAVRCVNRSGCFAFVVTNQAGVARGHYDLAQVDRFHARMDESLAECGAHIDEFRCSPYHPDAVVAAFRRHSECRKPKPGMIHDLAAAWPVDLSRSVLIGDRESDLAAAEAAGVRGSLYSGGDLEALVEAFLPGQ